MVTKKQITKMREPSLKLVDQVTIEMLGMVREVALKVSLPVGQGQLGPSEHQGRAAATFNFRETF